MPGVWPLSPAQKLRGIVISLESSCKMRSKSHTEAWGKPDSHCPRMAGEEGACGSALEYESCLAVFYQLCPPSPPPGMRWT